jgi:hypothetical protein
MNVTQKRDTNTQVAEAVEALVEQHEDAELVEIGKGSETKGNIAGTKGDGGFGATYT